MADEHHHYSYALEGQDERTYVVERLINEKSGFTYRISVRLTELADPIPSPELRVNILSADDYSDLSFELSGGISPHHRQTLIGFLESQGIPSVARNDAIGLIFSLYNTTDDVLKETLAHVEIETYYDVTPDDEDYDLVVGLSAEDYSLRPTRARRDIMEALEKVTVGPGAVIRETSCVICLEEFSTRSEVMKMPCSYVFHGDCIVRWLENRLVCPLCR